MNGSLATPVIPLADTGLSEALPIAALVILGAAAVGLAIRRRRGE